MSHINIARALETQENVFGFKHKDYMVFKDPFKIYCFFPRFLKTDIRTSCTVIFIKIVLTKSQERLEVRALLTFL